MSLKIMVNRDKCLGYAACLAEASELFDLDDDGFAVVLQPEPGPEMYDKARRSVKACPAGAITVEET